LRTLTPIARDRLAPALASALLAAGCGGRPPATFVGESAHFRLYVDPELMPLPAAFAGDNALAALETEWSDVATMLRTPDRKITYYWYAVSHVSDACGDSNEGGCTKEEEMEIDAALLPDAHELNHAYTYLRAPRRPIPLLAEGIAEAIGCGREKPLPATPNADWRTAAAGVASADVYGEGGLLVRHLIRTQGIDAFLRYYEQSPERRDPALFGANFESFWGVPLDDVWTEIHTPPASAVVDQKICPCSLPALVPNAELVDDPARAPYWTLPGDLGGETIALSADPWTTASIRDCAGALSPLFGKGLLARLDSTAGWYIPAPLAAAAIGRFASERCEDVIPYEPPADFALSYPYMTLTVPASTASADLFVKVQLPSPARISGVDEICDSCAFDQGTCQPLPLNGKAEVSGTFYARLRFNNLATAEQRAGLVTRELRFWE
jgi:hypothetical protein